MFRCLRTTSQLWLLFGGSFSCVMVTNNHYIICFWFHFCPFPCALVWQLASCHWIYCCWCLCLNFLCLCLLWLLSLIITTLASRSSLCLASTWSILVLNQSNWWLSWVDPIFLAPLQTTVRGGTIIHARQHIHLHCVISLYYITLQLYYK
jgi:hypothetical protein